jgi:hypothetical protein
VVSGSVQHRLIISVSSTKTNSPQVPSEELAVEAEYLRSGRKRMAQTRCHEAVEGAASFPFLKSDESVDWASVSRMRQSNVNI